MIYKCEFDKYIKNYRKIHTDNIKNISGQDSDYFSEYKIIEIKKQVPLPSKLKVLDLGCGDGNSAKYFLKHFDIIDYTGIDVSNDSINYASKQYADCKVQFKTYDGLHIPSVDNNYDVIFISCVLHHINPQLRELLFNDCYRVLKCSGKLIIFEHNPYNPITLKLVNNCPFDADAILMTAGMIKKMLKNTGFKTVKTRYTIFFPRKSIFNLLLFLEPRLSWLPIGGQYYLEIDKNRNG